MQMEMNAYNEQFDSMNNYDTDYNSYDDEIGKLR